MWLQWQRLNTPDHRERLDAGARLDWRWGGIFSSPLQTHIVHEGGQLYASGPVRDSFVLASGIKLSPRPEPPAPPGALREPPIAKLDWVAGAPGPLVSLRARSAAADCGPVTARGSSAVPRSKDIPGAHT